MQSQVCIQKWNVYMCTDYLRKLTTIRVVVLGTKGLRVRALFTLVQCEFFTNCR